MIAKEVRQLMNMCSVPYVSGLYFVASYDEISVACSGSPLGILQLEAQSARLSFQNKYHSGLP